MTKYRVKLKRGIVFDVIPIEGCNTAQELLFWLHVHPDEVISIEAFEGKQPNKKSRGGIGDLGLHYIQVLKDRGELKAELDRREATGEDVSKYRCHE